MARDEWLLDDYDPDQIHRKSVDGRGHSYRGQVRLPDSWNGIVGAMIARGDLPEYRTPQDFFRDAIYHRMVYWSKNEERTTPELKRLVAIERASTLSRTELDYVEGYETFVKEIEDSCNALARSNDNVRLAKHLLNLEDEAREAFDDPQLAEILERIGYWRKRSDRAI